MTKAPVSVVITTFNRREIVRDAIDSVLSQTLVPAQVIVIDDGSRDDTGPALRCSYGDRIVYRYQDNAGMSAARNQGISLADQPLVAFLDDDDVWHPRKTELQMRCFGKDPEIGLLGAEQFDWPALEFPRAPDDVVDKLVRVTWEQLVVRTLIPMSSVVVRRSVFGIAGAFEPSFGSEDRDFFLRVAEVTPVAMLNTPLTGYRDTPGSICKIPARREAAMRQILMRFDQNGAWRGRWLLRRKAYSYLHYGCSDANARAGNHLGAVARALKSLAWYPMPYRPGERRMRFDRPKRIAVNLLRAVRLKSPDRIGAARPIPVTNALRDLRPGTPESSLSIPSPL